MPKLVIRNQARDLIWDVAPIFTKDIGDIDEQGKHFQHKYFDMLLKKLELFPNPEFCGFCLALVVNIIYINLGWRWETVFELDILRRSLDALRC